MVLILVEAFDVGAIYLAYNSGLSSKEDPVDIKVETEKCCTPIELNEMTCRCNILQPSWYSNCRSLHPFLVQCSKDSALDYRNNNENVPRHEFDPRIKAIVVISRI